MTRIRYIRDGELLRTHYYNWKNSSIVATINTVTNYYFIRSPSGIIYTGDCKNVRSCKAKIRKIFKSLNIIKTDEVRK